MMESLWLPGLAVLAAGLGGGLWAARRLGAGSRAAAADDRDLELAIADLETRRDQIYAQLRGASGESLGEADRRELELSAARTLKELEKKRAGLVPRPQAVKKSAAETAPSVEPAMAPTAAERRPAPAGGFAARHPLVAGFLLGGGMVAVVGVLIYWAVRDAQPRPDEMGMETAAVPTGMVRGGMTPDEAHAGLDDLPITLRVELDALNERVAADDPGLSARRERALFYLGIERYVEAFEDANVLLAADPQDIDGLYVQGVVRLTMGQEEQALHLFDQVIVRFPDHVQALVWRGIILFRAGDRDGAIASWRRAIEAAGGAQPEIEELIRAAEEAPAPPVTETGSRPAPPSAPAAVPSDAYGVRVTIADGAFPPPGGVLFVSLRPAAGGPPVAVKRVNQVSGFPLDLTIGAADSMIGQPLPAEGIVRVRLDADGSASTRSPDDLEAEIEARQGGSVSLVLGEN